MNFPTSIQFLIDQLYEAPNLSCAGVRDLLLQAKVQEEDIEKWKVKSHSPKDCYGRTLIFDGGFFEILLISWEAGDYSAIHDHGYTQWGAVQTFGTLEHASFNLTENNFTTHNRFKIQPGQVLMVNHDLIHQMGNPRESQETVYSLHVYGNYDRNDTVTADARVYDLTHSTLHVHTGGSFYGITPNDKAELFALGDYCTTLRDQVECYYRYEKANNTDFLPSLEKFIIDKDAIALFMEELEATDSPAVFRSYISELNEGIKWGKKYGYEEWASTLENIIDQINSKLHV